MITAWGEGALDGFLLIKNNKKNVETSKAKKKLDKWQAVLLLQPKDVEEWGVF